MSTTMDQIHNIRELYYSQGYRISEIASATGLNPKTVSKYVDMEDFNTPAPKPGSELVHTSKLDTYKPVIDGWLINDKKAPRKQRHTAKRVFKRLKEEYPDFDCSYRLVALYVAAKKKELFSSARNGGYIPLIHHPGEAQADFGTADFYENGKLHHEAKYLVMSFPFSNGGYLQLNYGENMECLLEGLVAMFEHIGGVPTEIWFDNTSTIVTDIIRGGDRKITERFTRFSEHYRFKPVFMNPEAGWEKGNVENKVGYLRRNELVPVPEFEDLSTYNAGLLSACDKDMDREHYEDADDRFISELFEKDKAALLPLPSVPFETASYAIAPTDKYGKFTLNKGKHTYSSTPDFQETTVNLKITSAEVIVLDGRMNEVVRHRRLYGGQAESMEWVPYLRWIARKPRSLRNSGIYDMMPGEMQLYMDSISNSERGKILKVLAELSDRTGFDSALNTVNEAIGYNATDPDSLRCLYDRIYSDIPLLPPLESGNGIPDLKVIPFNSCLARLDTVLRKGGAMNG